MSDSPSPRHVAGPAESVVADLGPVSTAGPSGAVWGLMSPQLNMNLVVLQAGDEINEHVNSEVDVLVVVLGGSGAVIIDGVSNGVSADSVALIPRGVRRSFVAESPMRYYSIHRSGPGLTVG